MPVWHDGGAGFAEDAEALSRIGFPVLAGGFQRGKVGRHRGGAQCPKMGLGSFGTTMPAGFWDENLFHTKALGGGDFSVVAGDWREVRAGLSVRKWD
jgi:hypothetical protein